MRHPGVAAEILASLADSLTDNFGRPAVAAFHFPIVIIDEFPFRKTPRAWASRALAGSH